MGKDRMEWAFKSMPVLSQIRDRFIKQKPLKNVRVGACLHVTTETANLMRVLKDGGADVTLCASNPLSTQDDVAASLVKNYGIPTFAIKGENNKTYYSHINEVLDRKPQMTMDDGADIVSILHSKRKDLLKYIIGGTEETTTGVIRLRALENDGLLNYPIIAVNDAKTKHFFDNRYGTGQSTLDGIIRATNLLIAGLTVVVIGYGWCGRGVAKKAKGLGANVVVTEVDPLKGIEAVLDGYSVKTISEAAKVGDIFITLTGNLNVIRKEHFSKMKSGAVVCNSGHFNAEIDLPALKKLSVKKRLIRGIIDEYTLKNKKTVCVLADGRLINLSAAEGHPASVMDMSFANQALSAEYMIKNAKKLEKKVYVVPKNIDENISRLKLKAMKVGIDTLTKEQVHYLSSWNMGT